MYFPGLNLIRELGGVVHAGDRMEIMVMQAICKACTMSIGCQQPCTVNGKGRTVSLFSLGGLCDQHEQRFVISGCNLFRGGGFFLEVGDFALVIL